MTGRTLRARFANRWLALLIGIVCSQAAPTAQVTEIIRGARSIPRTSSKEVMERPIQFFPGAGRMHQKVSTDSTDAQAYYDQGIAYLHSYVWVDAARSFHEALRCDPGLAMAHVGLAKAYTGATAYEDAVAHLKKASDLAATGKVTAKEAKWIALAQQQLEAIFATEEDRTRRHQEYKDAIDRLIAMDPDDAHAWVLRGNAEERTAAGRGQGGRVGAIAYYDAALARDPDHFGAHHYLVHSYEGLKLYGKAAEHGKRYADAVPGVPHAQHMYAHVLPRLGEWEKALAQLAEADRVQRAYFATGIAPVEEWHHGHNLHLMGAVLRRLGRNSDAERLFREAFSLDVRATRDGRFTDPLLQFLLIEGRFEEALKLAHEAEQRPLAVARLVGAVRGAEALIAMKRFDEARKARKRASEALGQLRKEADNPIYRSLPDQYREDLYEPLEAQFALYGNNPSAGEKVLLKQADGFVGEAGLDGWVTALMRLDQIAGIARRAGRQQFAGAIEERLHKIDPGYVGRRN